VWRQLQETKKIAQSQFEDALSKEYRELIGRIPTKALLGDPLYGREYEQTFDELFHYVDLSNEQVSLRMRERIGAEVWSDWCEGIRSNLALPAFAKAWQDIKSRTTSFDELRRLESDEFVSDPADWRKRGGLS
jgi:hypothetical protein